MNSMNQQIESQQTACQMDRGASQVLTSLSGLEQSAGAAGRKRGVVKTVKAMMTRARAQAKTISQILAQIAQPAVRLMSPISQRRHPTAVDIGWAAGILDGEGCVHIARQIYAKASGRRPTFRLRVQIAQNSLEVLQEFEWSVGVSGRIHSPKPNKKQNKVCHSLMYDGLKAFLVLQKLEKHLRRKQGQAHLAKEFRKRCDIHIHPGAKGTSERVWQLREWYYKRMALLNQKG